MSSFRRHGSAAAAPLAAGVRPSSFSSPVPLISTGVSALDDILSGGGLSSGSILAILPATGTAAQSAAQIGASSSSTALAAETDYVALSAAEPYVELLLAYSVAQGIASKHRGVLVGESGAAFARGLMSRAGDLEEQQLAALSLTQATKTDSVPESGPSDQLDTVADDEDEETTAEAGTDAAAHSAEKERGMKIAWRYERMKQFSTTVPSGSSKPAEADQPFCNPFDLSKHIPPVLLEQARKDSNLEIAEVRVDSPQDSAYDEAFRRIEMVAQACKEEAQALKSAGPKSPVAPQPVLRISVRALGSLEWKVARGQTVEVEVIRFLRKLKCLLRGLALPDSATTTAIPAIAVVTLAASILSAPTSGFARAPCPNLPHRLAHTVDAAVSLSAFAPSPSLRTAFSAYTGALKVLKTPSIGTLTNPSIRASVLRGMGAGAVAPSAARGGGGESTGAVGEGGAGGGENNLAFKVRRKRLVIETLHLDIEGGVSERRTKPPKNLDAGVKQSMTQTETPSAPQLLKNAPQVAPQTQQTPLPTKVAAAAVKPKFGGLSSLRERGLAVANSKAVLAAKPAAQEPLEVELDTRSPSAASHSHPHSHTRSQPSRRPHPSTQFTSSRAQDYDF